MMTAHPEFDPERDLEIELVLDAPRAKVWRCMTEAKLVETWMCPRPWSAKDAVIEPFPGGRHGFTMVGPNGEEVLADGVVLEVEDGRRIVTTDAFTFGWKLAAEPFFTAVITLEDEADGRTHYRAEARHWTKEACDKHREMGFHDGWKVNAEQLGAAAREL